jgi:hypothetical protein
MPVSEADRSRDVRTVVVLAAFGCGLVALVVLAIAALIRYGAFAFILVQAVAGIAAAFFTTVVRPWLRR